MQSGQCGVLSGAIVTLKSHDIRAEKTSLVGCVHFRDLKVSVFDGTHQRKSKAPPPHLRYS